MIIINVSIYQMLTWLLATPSKLANFTKREDVLFSCLIVVKIDKWNQKKMYEDRQVSATT